LEVIKGEVEKITSRIYRIKKERGRSEEIDRVDRGSVSSIARLANFEVDNFDGEPPARLQAYTQLVYKILIYIVRAFI
jgi:hypothetical protein